MTRDEALEKIKKLLRMKRGGTQAEVETALNLARELAGKFGIDLGDVNEDEQTQRERPIGHEDAFSGGRIQWEVKYASMIARDFFNVSVFATRVDWKKMALRFVGTDWDRQIAIYVCQFLIGHFRREWRCRRGRCRNRRVFMYGMWLGLNAKLRDLEKQSPANSQAVVLLGTALQRRKAYIAEHFGELTTESTKPDDDAKEALYRGWRAGQDTEIRKGVDGGKARAAEQLGTSAEGRLLIR